MSSQEHISNTILDLLRRYPAINIPGIGCLHIKQIQQYLGSGKGLILPPTERLVLEPSQPEAPDLFDLIDLEERWTKKQKKVLTREIQRVLNDALNYGESQLGNLGILRKNENGELVLDSFPDVVNISSHLLPVLEISPLPAEKTSVRPSGNMARSKNTTLTQAENEVPGSKSWTFYVLPVLFIIAVTILAIFVLRRSFSKGKVLSQVESRIISPVNGRNEPPSGSTAEMFSNELLARYHDVLTEEAINEGCVIVVGSYSIPEYADAQSKKLKELGYRVHRSGSQPIRVGIRFDCTKYDLVQYYNDIREKIAPDAWFLIPQIADKDYLQPKSTWD